MAAWTGTKRTCINGDDDGDDDDDGDKDESKAGSCGATRRKTGGRREEGKGKGEISFVWVASCLGSCRREEKRRERLSGASQN
jgi:hypothetical protein